MVTWKPCATKARSVVFTQFMNGTENSVAELLTADESKLET